MAARSWNLPALVGSALAYGVAAALWIRDLLAARAAAGAASPDPFEGGFFWAALAFGTAFWVVLGARYDRSNPVSVLSYAAAGLHVFGLAARVVLAPLRWALENL
jgi:hypothetical protein